MKVKLIKNLKSRVLLVDSLPENETIDFYENGVLVASDFEFDGVDGKWQLLSTLKKLTDSDCEGLVESCESNCKDYVGGMYIFSAKESFLSSLESEGVLFENPHGVWNVENGRPISFPDGAQFDSPIELYNFQVKWDKAEQNVFSPETLVFVEQ